MAATVTTEFYRVYTTTSGYTPLSKVVFTSPNISSPADAGTRSHILPGELPLATWYEDSIKMYRYCNYQIPSSSYYMYSDPFSTTASGFHIRNSIKFQVTQGECYDCRVTAWDDVTHTSTANLLISTNRVKASAVAYRFGGTDIAPSPTIVFAPRYNFTLKGATSSGGTDYYYGDFNMIYATPTTTLSGDVCIFRPYLDNIDGTVTYGIHDFVITLHYSYT